jgi:hypothetical protein
MNPDDEVIRMERSFDPLDSGLEKILVDRNRSNTVQRVSGFHPVVGWLTVAALRASSDVPWSAANLVMPREMAGFPIPEPILDLIYPATKRLFAVHREAFGQ